MAPRARSFPKTTHASPSVAVGRFAPTMPGGRSVFRLSFPASFAYNPRRVSFLLAPVEMLPGGPETETEKGHFHPNSARIAMKPFLFSLIALVVTAGCRGTAMPDLFHPGPEKYQQSRAEYFDPYPSTDAGPEMVGTRPLEYQNPTPEVERIQRNPPSWTTARWCPWNWFQQ